MPLVDKQRLAGLQTNLDQIRNICILAHVDHGKTTLADSLVASNGIISQKMAGKLRYMDSRLDEQERGITMKSSSISLLYKDRTPERNEYVVNLIDSPGHVDFSSEVSTAVRLCDGAIVLVDVIEGVCPQTRICLKQAYTENLKPVLVLNKIDRLITEKKMSPLDAYVHISQVLEQVNVVMGHLFVTDVVSREVKTDTNDYTSGLEEADDSQLYFSPDSGNVIFCSAVDGWAFILQDFADLYDKLLGIPAAKLVKVLWGDYYLNTKTKAVVKGAQEKAKKPLFVQFVLENIWNLYDLILVRKDKEKIPVITEKLGIKLTARDLRHTDARIQLQSIFSQWLPIEKAVLEMVVRIVPAPGQMSEEKAERLMCSLNQNFASLPAETQRLKEEFQSSNKNSEHTIVFISKMISVEKSLLPMNKPKPLSQEEIERRRAVARERHQERMGKSEADVKMQELTDNIENSMRITETDVQAPAAGTVEEVEEEDPDEEVFIAFARVYSGTLRKGDKIYVLMPKHDPRLLDPSDPLKSPYISEVTVSNLYLLMGRELEELDEAPAGNIVGIGGLQQVLKTATLSSTLWCPSFCELSIMATPILRVAVEPVNPLDLPRLVKGLKLLNQSDACVQVIVQENGEHVLLTLGEVHLERCVADLETRYAKCKLNVSLPIVPFRETIVPAATVDMVNEAVVVDKTDKVKKSVTLQTASKSSTIRVLAVPLDTEVIELLESSTEILKALSLVQSTALPVRTRTALNELKVALSTALQRSESVPAAENIGDRIWTFGPKKCGSNILLNMSDFQHQSIWRALDETPSASSESSADPRSAMENAFVNGFQTAALAGPLAEEPVHGVCFIVEDWSVDEGAAVTGAQASVQIMTTVEKACRKAFQAQPQRLVTPMYSCNIIVSADVLGKMYAVIGRRHGKVLSADLTQGSGNFMVTAVLPVIESFNFAQDIRKQTSGLATPQLVFSHWEVVEMDPYWVPSTEEEYLHFGDKADSQNRAKLYMDSVRRRKGLHVDEKIVEHAEKQRTLSKNK